MVREIRKEIGGLGLQVSAVGCVLAVPDDPPYRSFMTIDRGQAGLTPGDVSVQVVAGSAPRIEGLPPVFDNDGTWRMFRTERGYLLSFSTTDVPRRDHVIVRADFPTKAVKVHCLDMLPGGSRELPQVFDPVRYPLDQILLMNHLAQGSGLIVHSAGLALEGMGMVFAGVSGAGKSTLTGIFAREAPEAELLSDDRIIVRQIDGRWHAYGTPWPGEAGVASNSRAGLGALFFLAKGPAHRLEPLSPAQALKRLLPVVSCPWYDSERLTGVLDTCERLVGQVPCFELRFKPGPGVVALLRDFVHRERGVWTRSESCPKPIP